MDDSHFHQKGMLGQLHAHTAAPHAPQGACTTVYPTAPHGRNAFVQLLVTSTNSHTLESAVHVKQQSAPIEELTENLVSLSAELYSSRCKRLMDSACTKYVSGLELCCEETPFGVAYVCRKSPWRDSQQKVLCVRVRVQIGRVMKVKQNANALSQRWTFKLLMEAGYDSIEWTDPATMETCYLIFACDQIHQLAVLGKESA